jgi:hypothetical protein
MPHEAEGVMIAWSIESDARRGRWRLHAWIPLKSLEEARIRRLDDGYFAHAFAVMTGIGRSRTADQSV